MDRTTGGNVEQFKVGDLVEYNSKFDEGTIKSVGLVVEVQRCWGMPTVLVQWCDYPHADVIGDTLEYACFELKRARGQKNKKP
jgi:hypothetical protein